MYKIDRMKNVTEPPTSTLQNVENVDPTKWQMYFLEELIGFGG